MPDESPCEERSRRRARREHGRIAECPIINTPWQIATGGDLAFPGVEGPRPPQVKLINRYLTRLHAAAEQDEVLSVAFVKVANLLAAPPTLMSPKIMMRVLRFRG